jgi:hypothetical protein
LSDVGVVTLCGGTQRGVCLIFVPGIQSDPYRQFNLLSKGLMNRYPGITIKYISWGRKNFNFSEVSGRLAKEVLRGEFDKYVLVGLSFGGNIVYGALKAIEDVRWTVNVCGVLLGASADRQDIVRGDLFLASRLFRLSSVFNIFSNLFWRIMAQKRDISACSTEVAESYENSLTIHMTYPLYLWGQEVYSGYTFRTTSKIKSKLFLVNAIHDGFVSVANEKSWADVADDITLLSVDGRHADVIFEHEAYTEVISKILDWGRDD